MARARLLKPGFFTNEDLVELDFASRLLFAGLWTLADREGRLEDRPKRIKMAVFPADNVDVDARLSLLADRGFIIRYSVNDTAYVEIINFGKHQTPHHREPGSLIPAPETIPSEPPVAASSPRPALGQPASSRAVTGNQLPVTSNRLPVREGACANGVPASNGAHPPARAAPPPRLIAIPDPFRIPDEFWEWAEEHGYKTAWVKERIELYALQYHGSDVRRTAEEWIAKCQKWIMDDATKPPKSMAHR